MSVTNDCGTIFYDARKLEDCQDLVKAVNQLKHDTMMNQIKVLTFAPSVIRATCTGDSIGTASKFAGTTWSFWYIVCEPSKKIF